MRIPRTVLVALSLAVVAVAFLPCLKGGFFNWDDGEYVVSNPVIRSLAPANLGAAFSSFFVGHYQPLTILSYSLDHRLSGLNPFGYHLTNFLLHLSNCLLVIWLFRRVTGNVLIACVTGLVFGLHPLRAESVAWISARKELLYASFFLCALIAYDSYLKKGGARGYLLAFLFFLCALLSKVTAAILPLVLFLFDYLAGKKFDRRSLVEKVPFFLASIILGLVNVFGQASAGAVRQEGAGLLEKAGVAAAAVFFYLGKTFIPVNLSCAYPRFSTNGAVMAVSAVSLAVFICLVMITGRFTKKMVFGFCFFLICLLPVLQFVPLGSVMAADRYTYVPAIGLAYLLAEGFGLLWQKSSPARKYLSFFSVCVLIVLAGLTWDRCFAWRDSVSLWSREIRDRPGNPTAYFGRGSAYLGLRMYKESYLDLKTCLYLAPEYKEVYLKLAKLYRALNKKDDMIWALRRYCAAFPGDADARAWLEAIDKPGNRDVQYKQEDML